MTETQPRPRRLSDIVKSINTKQELTIGTLVDAFGERAFGALMFVFAVLIMPWGNLPAPSCGDFLE